MPTIALMLRNNQRAFYINESNALIFFSLFEFFAVRVSVSDCIFIITFKH